MSVEGNKTREQTVATLSERLLTPTYYRHGARPSWKHYRTAQPNTSDNKQPHNKQQMKEKKSGAVKS